MRILITIALACIAIAARAQLPGIPGILDPAFRARVESAAALKDLTSDYWQDFEMATVDATNLGNQDHGTGGTWTVAGSPTTSTGASQSALFTYGGTTDSGTRGMSTTANAENRVEFAWASVPASSTSGFWFQPAALASGKYSYFYYAGVGKFSAQCWLMLKNEGGQHKISIENALSGSQTSAQTVDVSTGTWYWIVVRAQNAATCTLAIYNTSGSQVGTDETCTGASQNADKVGLGVVISDDTTGNQFLYDNWVFENADSLSAFRP